MKLIVPYNKEKLQIAPFFSFILFFTCFCLIIFSDSLKGYLGYISVFLMQVTMGGVAFLYLSASIYMIYFLQRDVPAAILNDQGIWIDNFNLIPWQDVTYVEKRYFYGVPLETIAIHVNNLNRIKGQANFAGKCRIFWGEVFQYPPILISNAAIDHDHIILFANEFMKSKIV